MDFNYEAFYGMEDEVATVFGIFYLIYCLVSVLVGITVYVLSSLGLYTIAKRRGIANPWLAWIPVANVWIVGSISDQYRYVTRGQIKNKRKILLGLFVGMYAAIFAMFAVMMTVGTPMGDTAVAGIGMVLAMLLFVLSIFGGCIAYAVIYFMAMYDLYTSVNPPYNVVFLVLSIVFRVTEPFFIFFNRKKDLGMPPRREAPAAPVIPAPVQEPWENNPES